MTHSLGASSPGATGVAYASGIRMMPGGSAFTLTGIFVDRITPRLMRVAAMAKATTAAINSTAPAMRGQVSILQNQAMKVKIAANNYRLLTRRVKEYNTELLAAGARSRARYPMYDASGKYLRRSERAQVKAARTAYMKPYKRRLAEETYSLGLVKEQLVAEGARLKIEKAITREKWKQLALVKESMRAGFGDLTYRGVARKGLKYGAIAGIAGIAIAGLGVVALGAMQAEYTKVQARVRAIGQLSLTEIGNVSAFVLEQTKVLAISASEAMGGMLTLVRAGIRSTEEMRGIADPAMKLSVVNAIKLDEAMRNILVVQNAFNLSRETGNEIAANQQILINQSLMDFNDYVDGMKYAIAWSNKLGLTYQQTAAAIATMTDAGIRAGIGGRGLRRMFSKFAQDLEIIEQKLKRGGSELTVFSEDGILNLSALLHELGESGDTVEDLEFALSTFGLRGSTAFLTLAQHADEFDKHVKSQTGDINELNSAVKDAQESMSGQLTLLKNELAAVMLDEKLVEPMKDLVYYMREEGGVQKMGEQLGELLGLFVEFWKEGGFKALTQSMKTLLSAVKTLMPFLLGMGRILLEITKRWYLLYPLIILSRAMKMGTILNRMVTSLATYIALRRVESGMPFGRAGMFMGSRFVDPTYMMMAQGGFPYGKGVGGAGIGTQTSLDAFGKKTPKSGLLTRIRGRMSMRGAGGAAGMMGLGGVGAIVGIGALVAYLAYRQSEANKEAQRDELDRKYKVNQVNFAGANIYGFDDLNRHIEESDRYTYENSKRYY